MKNPLRVLGLRAFPEYKGRKIRGRISESVTLQNLNWDGGTKTTYRIVRLKDGASVGLDALGQVAPWSNRDEGRVVPMADGYAVVSHAHFCGQDCGLCVYLPASAGPKYLPAAPVAMLA